MESVARDVDKIESDERRVYEAVLGHALHENQQVILRVIELKKEPDESVRRKAREEFHELCREGTENRERQGIAVDEADQSLEEAAASIVVRKEDVAQVVPHDPDDDHVVAAAVVAGADVLCTRNRHLRHEDVVAHCRRYGVEVMDDLELLRRLREAEPEP